MHTLLAFVRKYWVPFIVALGTILLAIPDKIEGRMGFYFLCGGAALILSGLIAQTYQIASSDTLRDKINRLQNNIERLQSEIDAKDNKILETTNKSLFIVSSAITDPWQTELLQQILNRIQISGFDAVLYTPTRNHNRGEHAAFLQQIFEQADRFAGGIIIPIFPEEGNSMYIEFMNNFKKPIVFVDNPPSERETDYTANSAFCGVDPREGGRLAARAVSKYRTGHMVDLILVISSPSQTRRQEEFERQITSLMPDVRVIVDTSGNFDRANAKSVTLDFLQDSRANRRAVHLLFCISDAMTLGAIDAINTFDFDRNFDPPRVIGFDGVYETMMLARMSSSCLINVVVQDTAILSQKRLRRSENCWQVRKSQRYLMSSPSY